MSIRAALARAEVAAIEAKPTEWNGRQDSPETERAWRLRVRRAERLAHALRWVLGEEDSL